MKNYYLLLGIKYSLFSIPFLLLIIGCNKTGETTIVIKDNPVIIEIDGIKLEMVKISPGSFSMGSPADETGRKTDENQHEVTLKNAFWINKYEITQEQFEKIMGFNPSKFKGENKPVECVSWLEAMEFCKKLTKKYKKINTNKTSNVFRLPTEAEWEYSCRGNTTTPYSFGDKIDNKFGNFAKKTTCNVGIFKPNPFGLYDMHGNVSEWCLDRARIGYLNSLVHTKTYSKKKIIDPIEKEGTHSIVRGGRFLDNKFSRSASRRCDRPGYKYEYIGFRVVLGTPITVK